MNHFMEVLKGTYTHHKLYCFTREIVNSKINFIIKINRTFNLELVESLLKVQVIRTFENAGMGKKRITFNSI